MVQWGSNGPKAGFIACDILLGEPVTAEGLSPFIHKCTTLRSLAKVGRTMNVFVAQEYTKDAFILAKRYGIMPATPESLFGKDVARALIAVMEIINRAAHTAIDPTHFEEVFQRLGSIEGAMANLRGALFEFLVANVMRTKCGNVELNRLIRLQSGQKVEIDVVAWQPNKLVTLIECKGYAPYSQVPDGEIEDWLTKTIPTAVTYARKAHPDWSNLELRFELWTTGKLSEEAKAFIAEKAEVRPQKYTVALYEPNAVLAQARETGDKTLARVLQKYFLEDPFRVTERAVRSRRGMPKSIFEEYLVTSSPDDHGTIDVDHGA